MTTRKIDLKEISEGFQDFASRKLIEKNVKYLFLSDEAKYFIKNIEFLPVISMMIRVELDNTRIAFHRTEQNELYLFSDESNLFRRNSIALSIFIDLLTDYEIPEKLPKT